jgi:hypothetical protein
MDNNLKSILITMLALVCAADAFTTVLGLYSIVRPVPGNELSWIMCIGPALIILALLMITEFVWEGYGGIFVIIRVLWFVALMYDIYTSFVANLVIVALGASALATMPLGQAWSATTSGQIIAVSLGTVLMSVAPMLLPYITKRF